MSVTNVIPGAEASPRVANGCICWYEGDTFAFDLELLLEDQDGESVQIAAEDSLTLVFYDAREEVVQQFSYTGAENNRIRVSITPEISATFPKGDYTYDLRLTHGNRTTLMRKNIVHVE